MGNDHSKHKLLQQPHLFAEKLSQAEPLSLVYSCSYERWIEGAHYICGFADTGDYSTIRDDFRRKGFALRPDNTDGRFLKVHRISETKILIEEKRTHNVYTIYIPACFTSGKIPQRLRNDYRTFEVNYIQQQTTKDGMSVIGCHGNFAVVQVLDRKECYVPEFYFINLEMQQCIGKFQTKDAELIWYECYVSPDQTQVVLRPDVNTYEWSAPDIPKVHKVNNITVVTMKKFADSEGHILTYDNRSSRNYMFRAKEKNIQLFDISVMDVIKSSKNLPLPAPIRQLKSSPSGEYVAARCVFPAYGMEFQVNVIVIVSSSSLEVLQQIDSRGSYWALSEVVNLQVFPRFSSCDSALAIMKHGSSKRKVYIYRLPLVCTSLQQLCRCVIRRLVFPHNIQNLPLPVRIQKFLMYL